MKRVSILMFMAVSGIAFAQAQSTASSGGWRRVGDTPSAQPPATQSEDPTQPVDRGDSYGQTVPGDPAAAQAAEQAVPRAGRPAYGLPPQLTLPGGTYVTVRVNDVLTTDRNQVGDPFSATLVQPIVVDGVVVAQSGQTVYGRVADVARQHADRPSRLGLELATLTLADGTQVPVRSQLVSRQGGRTPAGEQAATVAGTTAVGAAIGAAADWGTGAAVGGGIGAAAGLAGVLLTRNHATVVYPETALTFRVESPITISTLRAPQAFRFVGPEDYQRPQMVQARPRPQPRLYPYPAPYPYYYGPYYPYPYWGTGIGIFWGGGGYYRYGHARYGRWRR
jgi:hypothetical protein